MADTFTRFPPGGITFLAGLAADNTRTYFSANRGTYPEDVAAQLRALVVAVCERLHDKAVGRTQALINSRSKLRQVR